LFKGKEGAPNSPFTTALLRNFQISGLGLKQVIERTREDVYQLAKSVKHDQSPAVYDLLFGGDVLLLGEPEKIVDPVVPPISVDSISADFEFARSLNSKATWEAFLARHDTANNLRVALARKELKAIIDKENPPFLPKQKVALNLEPQPIAKKIKL
jgi:hypothetical protein